MKIMARYIHGSADSRDCDVIYIVDELPSFQDCQAFCSADAQENRNICTVRDGAIEKSFKGLSDEVNNALLATYPLHPQDCALMVNRSVERDRVLKDLSVLRKSLMMLRHTNLKTASRQALRGSYTQRVRLLDTVELGDLRWTIPEWEMREHLKRTAFQMGQAVLLADGIEVYTKGDLAAHLPALRPYLERRPCSTQALSDLKRAFLLVLSAHDIEDGDHLTVWDRGGAEVRHISIRGKEAVLEVNDKWS